MNRPTPISVFSDQRRTKSITWSRLSCGAQLPVKVPQDFFLARCAPPSTRPGPRPWSAPSSPRTQSVSASPPPDGGDAPEPERRPLRSRRTPSASGRTPSAASPVPHTGPRPEPCPEGGASEWPPSPLRCNAFVPFSYVRSAILTDERFLHFQLRQDTAFGYSAPHPGAGGTSTLLNNALLSAHYGAVRLLQHVHVRRTAMCLHGPAFADCRRRTGDLPVLVHVVSQRARVLRLRRTGQPLASNAAAVLPSSYSSGSRHPDLAFFEAQSPRPPMPRSTLRNTPRDVPRKTRGQDGVAFSFPVGLLHPLQHAGLTRRTTCNAQPVLLKNSTRSRAQ